MSRLTRDGTAEPVSRDQIIGRQRGQGNIHFPRSADHEQDWQPYPIDPYFLLFFFLFSFNLTYSRWTSSLPSCLWSLRIFPSLPGSRLPIFYRDASSALLQLVNQWLNFYLLTFPRFPLRRKERKSYFSENRTHDFRTSRCAIYLLDHSGVC